MTRREVAIKRVSVKDKKKKAVDTKREMLIMAGLDHPYICKLLET